MEGPGGELLIASFLVTGTKDQPAHLGPSQGPGAHHTGFYGDVNRTLVEVFAAQLVGGCRDGLHLGMGRHIIEQLGEV